MCACISDLLVPDRPFFFHRLKIAPAQGSPGAPGDAQPVCWRRHVQSGGCYFGALFNCAQRLSVALVGLRPVWSGWAGPPISAQTGGHLSCMEYSFRPDGQWSSNLTPWNLRRRCYYIIQAALSTSKYTTVGTMVASACCKPVPHGLHATRGMPVRGSWPLT